MSDKEGDDRFDKSSKDSETYSSQFFDEAEIEENCLLKKKFGNEITKKSNDIKIYDKQLDKCRCGLNLSSNSIENIPNMIIDLNNDLYRFIGIRCNKINNSNIFEFSAGTIVTNDNLFAVEIIDTGDCYKLGKWVMPISTDMENILSEYTFDKHKNWNLFVQCCKQHINCYIYRQQQYNDLKNILSNTINCSLDANLGLTRIHLHISGIKLIDTEEIYNITLFMAYKSYEGLPYLMNIETRDSTLSPKINKIFNKYFKPFKMVNLCAAFEKIINDKNYFVWKKVSKDSDNVDDYITEEIDEESMSKETKNNDSKKINSESSLENDPTESEIENKNNKYSSNSIEIQKVNKKKSTMCTSKKNGKAKRKTLINENKVQSTLNNKFIKTNRDELIENEENRVKKERKSLNPNNSGKNSHRKKKEEANDTNKSKNSTNKMLDKTNVETSIKDDENREEENEKKSPSTRKRSVNDSPTNDIKINNRSTKKSKTVLNKMLDKTNGNASIRDKKNKNSSTKSLKTDNTNQTNVVKNKTISSEVKKSNKKINHSMKLRTESKKMSKNNQECNLNTTKTNLYECFNSTPIVDKKNNIHLPEISAIASLPTNVNSEEDLTNISLNENNDNSSTICGENEQFNEIQTKELLRDIQLANKTLKEKDIQINNTAKKSNKRNSVKKQIKKNVTDLEKNGKINNSGRKSNKRESVKKQIKKKDN